MLPPDIKPATDDQACQATCEFLHRLVDGLDKARIDSVVLARNWTWWD